jgi:hypothetical protein
MTLLIFFYFIYYKNKNNNIYIKIKTNFLRTGKVTLVTGDVGDAPV